MMPGLYINRNLNLLVELSKNRDHAVERETVEPRVADAGEVRVWNAGKLLCCPGA
jgi:hypothetical protein